MKRTIYVVTLWCHLLRVVMIHTLPACTCTYLDTHAATDFYGYQYTSKYLILYKVKYIRKLNVAHVQITTDDVNKRQQVLLNRIYCTSLH